MSDEVIIEETIPGEWWWIGSILNEKQHENLPPIERVKILERTKNGFTATPIHRTLGELGTVIIAGDDTKSKTIIRINTPQAYTGHWQGLIASIRSLAEHAYELHRRAFTMTAEGAIEYYYRARAAGRKITLGEVAAIIGLSEKRLRNAKVEYDRAGKWGSKRKSK